MGQQRVRDYFADAAQLIERSAEIDSIGPYV